MSATGHSDLDRLRGLLSTPLPALRDLRATARNAAAHTRIGVSAFLREQGMSSELEYKQQAVREQRIMYHAHIGMNDVHSTAAALRDIHRELAARGHRLDRAGFALDRRMGLPPARRDRVAAETGPRLAGDGDWEAQSPAIG